jgi:pilus assembly protein CpaE
MTMNTRPLRLVLVTNNVEQATQIERSIEAQGWQLLACVGRPVPFELLDHLRIDLFLVDLDLPAALDLVKTLTRRPASKVIALASAARIGEWHSAMQMGVKELVSLPVDPQTLVETVRQIAQSPAQVASAPPPPEPARYVQHRNVEAAEARPVHQANSAQVAPLGAAQAPHVFRPIGSYGYGGRIIALTGLRGGVGRSTLAANLAVSLRSRLNVEVILAEAHHDLGQLALMLNMMPRYTIASLAGDGNIDMDMVRSVLQPHASGIQLFSAPLDVTHLVEFTPETWRNMLHILRQLAHFVVIDTSAHADAVLSEVLTNADDIYVVCGPDIFSLRSSLSLLETLRSQADKVRGRVQVLFNRSGVRGGLDEVMLQRQLQEQVAASFIDDTPLATYAMNRGVPFVLSHRRASLTRSMSTLADSYNVQVQQHITPRKPFALLPMLGRS